MSNPFERIFSGITPDEQPTPPPYPPLNITINTGGATKKTMKT